MFIQSDDYIDFVSPVAVHKMMPKRLFLLRYYIIKLKHEMKFMIGENESIYTNTLIIEQRFPFSLLGLRRLPKEVLVMTPNYYDKKSTDKKKILAIADLYEGSPQF